MYLYVYTKVIEIRTICVSQRAPILVLGAEKLEEDRKLDDGINFPKW